MLVLHGVVYPKTPVICADISFTRLGAMVHRGGGAIVIGASMGGLLAARALAEHYDRVTIIERDELPESPEPPKGVPPGRHPHALHARGREGLEQLFPGLTDELVAEGALRADGAADFIWFNRGFYLCDAPSTITVSRFGCRVRRA